MESGHKVIRAADVGTYINNSDRQANGAGNNQESKRFLLIVKLLQPKEGYNDPKKRIDTLAE